jgi:hypothetical protein
MRSKASASFLKKRSKKLFLMLGHWLWRGHRPSLIRHAGEGATGRLPRHPRLFCGAWIKHFCYVDRKVVDTGLRRHDALFAGDRQTLKAFS